MLEIFAVQFLGAAAGAVSIGLADWLYNKARIQQSLHSFWVSASIAIICLPVLGWTSNVFLGSEGYGQVVAGMLVAAIFFSVYRNLRKLPSVRSLEPPLPPPRRSSGPLPPVSKLKR